MSDPDPPVNVRIIRADGTEAPVELYYAGLDDHGLHEWMATPSSPRWRPGDSITADRIPARTTISLGIETDESR